MVNKERYGTRCSVYSTWHRTIVGISMIDIDGVETCKKCQKPLALIETLRSGGYYDVHSKPTSITRQLAELSSLPSYVVEYIVDSSESVLALKVLQMTPGVKDFGLVSPIEWVEELKGLRELHKCPEPTHT